MRGLFRFELDKGEQGSVVSLFVADVEEVEATKGEIIHFGDVLGEHSEVMCTLDDSVVELVTEDPAFIDRFMELKCEVGPNPLEHVKDWD